MAKRAGGRAKKVHHLTAASLTAGSPEIEAPTLTVGGLAELLRPFAPDTAASAQRMRNWTRENFLSPVKMRHAGTGKHQEYDQLSLLDAAILTVIADAGFNLAQHSYLPQALSEVRRAIRNRSGSKLFLEIEPIKGRDPKITVHEGAEGPNSNAQLSILLNVNRIISDLFEAAPLTVGSPKLDTPALTINPEQPRTPAHGTSANTRQNKR
jgi:hypothetical protein